MLTVLNAIPLMSVPVSIQTAENEFSGVYGENWRCDIPQK
ncbi:unnamed protein product [marine sediment metagenome]|uniref:Uncharacterized protein n=1 Tax=marine sediment metagenome TaxID=412755 RepID=X1ATV7_9ZZZZ